MLLVTDFNRDRYIQAIKAIRASGDATCQSLRAAKDAMDGLRDRNQPILLRTHLTQADFDPQGDLTVSQIPGMDANAVPRDICLDFLLEVTSHLTRAQYEILADSPEFRAFVVRV